MKVRKIISCFLMFVMTLGLLPNVNAFAASRATAALRDGTPIYDIKPYLAYVDSHPDARSGFAEEKAEYELKVIFPEELLAKIPVEKQKALVEVLKQDPRPAYQEDENRIYGVAFAGMNVRFYVREGVLTVVEVEKI